MTICSTNQPQMRICPTSLSQTCVSKQSVTKFIALIALNLFTPKPAAKQEFLFNKPASWVGLLNI